MLRQYILTRFNLRLWRRNKFLQPVNDSKWLEERFVLFEKYCLPSIMAQTQQNFRWIILFDAETPQEYRKRIKELRQRCPQLTPVPVEPEHSWCFAKIFQQCVKYDLEQLAQEGIHPRKITTTYLDNDDALAKDYLQRIADESASVECRSIITFHYGVQYFEGMQLANRILYRNNHFQTLVEPFTKGQQALTIYGIGSHANLYRLSSELALIREIKTPDSPAWVEVVHGKNIGNDVRPTFHTKPLTSANLLKDLANLDAPLTTIPRLKFCTIFALRFIFEVFRHILICIFTRQFHQLLIGPISENSKK